MLTLAKLNDFAWQVVANIVSKPKVADYLIKRAQRTPYFHLDGYMNRWWLFNAYDFNLGQDEKQRHERRRWSWLPSIRIHHILREDEARDMHDHPWEARTIILKGWYSEQRYDPNFVLPRWYERFPGDTAKLRLGEYHNIKYVSSGGVYTMFFTWKYMGTWGFLVNGVKVPWREYVNGGAA